MSFSIKMLINRSLIQIPAARRNYRPCTGSSDRFDKGL